MPGGSYQIQVQHRFVDDDFRQDADLCQLVGNHGSDRLVDGIHVGKNTGLEPIGKTCLCQEFPRPFQIEWIALQRIVGSPNLWGNGAVTK